MSKIRGQAPEAMLEAATASREAGTRWVLDPVGVGVLPVRTAFAHRLAGMGPAVIRGNASEIRALSGNGSGGRGVDSVDEVDDAADDAVGLARSTGAVVAVSGIVDLVTDGNVVVRIGNGHELFTQITGAGCALGGVIAAFAATGDDTFTATVAACATYAVAGELAARDCGGPGSFAVALLDALHRLDGPTVSRHGRLS